MPPVGFESTILVSKRPQTHALDRAVTGIGYKIIASAKTRRSKECGDAVIFGLQLGTLFHDYFPFMIKPTDNRILSNPNDAKFSQISVGNVLRDDYLERVGTFWMYYVLNFKYKLILTYCVLVSYYIIY
jgi:hypothetical protein